MREDAKYWIVLSLVNGLGDVLIKNLFTKFRNAEEVFGTPLNELTSTEGISERTARAVKRFKWEKVESEVDKLENSGYAFLPLNNPGYPAHILQIYTSSVYLHEG
jgi:predicted Rossmann fold nucleotide-binding protein DprA/Smf involved in DNA uptake